MPAQHRRRSKFGFRKSATSKKKPGKRFFLALILLLLVTFLFYKLFFATKYWDENKISIVILMDNEDVLVSTLDPKSQEIVNINIPADTEVEVARDLGVFKLKNVWKLGEAENGEGGKLLAATVTKYFSFPVYIWSRESGLGLINKNPRDNLRGLLTGYDTNLSLADRLRILLFSYSVAHTRHVVINLQDTPVLRQTTLRDGSVGFVKTRNVSQRTLAVFVEEKIVEGGFSAAITNNGASSKDVSKVAEVMEVLGAKVVYAGSGKEGEITCRVRGRDEAVNKKVAKIFSCEESEEYQGGYGLELIIGSRFSEVF